MEKRFLQWRIEVIKTDRSRRVSTIVGKGDWKNWKDVHESFQSFPVFRIYELMELKSFNIQ